jgi:hypothetical protein
VIVFVVYLGGAAHEQGAYSSAVVLPQQSTLVSGWATTLTCLVTVLYVVLGTYLIVKVGSSVGTMVLRYLIAFTSLYVVFVVMDGFVFLVRF